MVDVLLKCRRHVLLSYVLYLAHHGDFVNQHAFLRDAAIVLAKESGKQFWEPDVLDEFLWAKLKRGHEIIA